MSTSGNGAKGVLGGILTLALVAGMIYLRFTRSERRAERREARNIAFDTDHALWKEHALELMKSAPGSKGPTDKGIGEYLAWGVDTYHAEVDAEVMDSFTPTGSEYRDALIARIFERARQDGREDVSRSLEKFQTTVKLADPAKWWVVEKKK